ncbi:MAG: altronate hydrolase [Candidatus Lokiarchaeota archaeon]|nr:altronate hydrolase [Candidatus Lokiarchaeota archaeon]
MKNQFIIMNPNDNCATALELIPEGYEVKVRDDLTIKITRNIKMGHKFALKNIKKGDYIIKYGEIIGIAKENIEIGDWVHIRNVESAYMGGVKE